jgi:hypothetical protein
MIKKFLQKWLGIPVGAKLCKCSPQPKGQAVKKCPECGIVYPV